MIQYALHKNKKLMHLFLCEQIHNREVEQKKNRGVICTVMIWQKKSLQFHKVD